MEVVAISFWQDAAKTVILLGVIGLVAFLINLYGNWDDRRRFRG